MRKFKFRKITALVLVFAMMIGMSGSVFAEEKYTPEEIDMILISSGMPENEVVGMYPDIKEFIVKNSGIKLEYIPSQLGFSGFMAGDAPINLSAPSFKVTSGGKVYYDIYPSYETMSPINPKGNDAFAFVLGYGMSIVPQEFSGEIYFKDPSLGYPNWTHDGSLSASDESIYGYSVNGSQLGTPGYPIYLRGNCYFRAEVDANDAPRKINLRYIYDRSGSVGYSVGLNFGLVNFSISSGSSSNLQHKTDTFSL